MCAPAPSRRCDDPACPLCTAGILPRPDLTEPVSGRAYQDLQEILAIATRRLHEVEAELRAARPCVDRVRAHVLNDEIYCAKCMEALVAYEKTAGRPVTTPEATRTHTGQFTIQLTEEANTNGR